MARPRSTAAARVAVTAIADPPPEADRHAPFPHPRHTASVIGHDAAAAELKAAFDGDRSHHAWLLAGPAGIGKATLAYAAARYWLADRDEREQPGLGLGLGFGLDGSGAGAAAGAGLGVAPDSVAARQVAALSHPGLLLLRRPWDGKAKRHLSSIPVDEVRRLKSFLAHSAGGGERRVVIADRLDEMNVNAANALLKGLEEPPASVVFLLVCSEPGRVLPTIRSRCRLLTLRPLAAASVLAAARAAAAAADEPVELPDGDGAAGLVALAEGSVGRLLRLATRDGLRLGGQVAALFERLPRVDWAAVSALADDLQGPDRAEQFDQAWELLVDRLARLVRARLGAPQQPEDLGVAHRVIAADRIGAATDLFASAVASKAELDALNLDRRTLLIGFVRRLAALGG